MRQRRTMSKRYRKSGRTTRQRTLAQDLDFLLGDLCVGLGFCNRLSGADLLREHGTITDRLFANLVLTAEGMNPLYEDNWHQQISQKFRDRFGREAVSDSDDELE
ncbi:hypothetical protein QFZ27_006383 [Inquilinus ginsengisoli]|uniref:hypothetical protein n=1 Tax=Inquilinus ginsengisoli TaxID=363840 RepID=UPI003D198280